MEINDLIFEPIVCYTSGGNQTQVCSTTYKNIGITWRTYFPWSIFKEPTDSFVADLILPMDTIVENGNMSDAYYTEEGYGLPQFKTLEDTIKFIDNYEKL